MKGTKSVSRTNVETFPDKIPAFGVIVTGVSLLRVEIPAFLRSQDVPQFGSFRVLELLDVGRDGQSYLVCAPRSGGPHILRVWIEPNGGTRWASSPAVPGENLAVIFSHLRSHGGVIPAPVALAILRAELQALIPRAEQYGPHGSLVPGHVVVGFDGRVSLTPPIDAGTVQRPGIEQARYGSPEHVEGRPLTPASDLFALGSLLFETLSGRPLFDGRTISEVHDSILKTRDGRAPLPIAALPQSRAKVAVETLLGLGEQTCGHMPSAMLKAVDRVFPSVATQGSREIAQWMRTLFPERLQSWMRTLSEASLPPIVEPRILSSVPNPITGDISSDLVLDTPEGIATSEPDVQLERPSASAPSIGAAQLANEAYDEEDLPLADATRIDVQPRPVYERKRSKLDAPFESDVSTDLEIAQPNEPDADSPIFLDPVEASPREDSVSGPFVIPVADSELMAIEARRKRRIRGSVSAALVVALIFFASTGQPVALLRGLMGRVTSAWSAL
jgi:hypothetical protein